MHRQQDQPPQPFARPVPPDRRPQRVVLPLDDGYQTYAYVHRPASEPTGLPVVYVHGIQSHPGWFIGSAMAMAEAGHTVFQVARRGSGDGEQARGDCPSAEQLLQDVSAACRFAVRQTGLVRLHLVGVSWGGKLLCTFACRRREGVQIASLTLIAPGIVPRVDVRPLTKIAIGACLLLAPRRTFQVPLSDVGLFTDNEPMRQYLRSDPHRLHRATARFLYASRRLDRMLRRAPWGAIQVPTTLIISRRDRIIDNARTRRDVDRLTGGRAIVHELDGAHTLEFEPDPSAFFRVLRESLGDQASPPR
jgi:acylglycerol lipase